jgi:hypothetical protein
MLRAAGLQVIETPSAYGFPLLIKGLLESGVTRAPEQEIVSANQNRFTYWEFAERVGRLASGLASLGVERGDTVAIMDWDTHRYLECFFAVPMMGAVLHTVNVRLSAEQILYTINHADDDDHSDRMPSPGANTTRPFMVKKVHYCWFGSAQPRAVMENIANGRYLTPTSRFVIRSTSRALALKER